MKQPQSLVNKFKKKKKVYKSKIHVSYFLPYNPSILTLENLIKSSSPIHIYIQYKSYIYPHPVIYMSFYSHIHINSLQFIESLPIPINKLKYKFSL